MKHLSPVQLDRGRRPLCQRRILIGLIVLLANVWCVPDSAFATNVVPGQGVAFAQVDFTYPGATQTDSQYGVVDVNVPALVAATGISTGYLNVVTSTGWVVRDLPILFVSYPDISAMFDLGSSGDVSSLLANVDYSASPSFSFSGVPGTVFAVGAKSENAQGDGALRAAPPGPPPNIGAVVFLLAGLFDTVWQSGHPNIEQDANQCSPASVANSFDWLRTKHGVPVPAAHAHIPGTNVNPGTLVGQMDINWPRAPGAAAPQLALVTGKLGYIDNNGLTGLLSIKHKRAAGSGLPAGNIASPVGASVSVEDLGAGTLFEWIISELRHNEDVEMRMQIQGGIGHVVQIVGAGRVFGAPWIAWRDDANQGNPGGLRTAFSFLNGNQIIGFAAGGIAPATMTHAVSESKTPEPPPVPSLGTLGTILLALLVACSAFTMLRRQPFRAA